MTSPVQVMLVEPDGITSAVLRKCLDSSDFDVVEAAVQIEALRSCALEQRSQVMVVGPTVPRADVADAVTLLLAEGCRTLVVASSVDEPTLTLLLAGASGLLLLEDASADGVAQAVQTVATGATALHPLVVQAVLERWRSDRAVPPSPSNEQIALVALSLTAREREVLQGIQDGLTSRQLASRLGVAEKTVEAHKSRLYAKLGARNQAHAVRIASERGLG